MCVCSFRCPINLHIHGLIVSRLKVFDPSTCDVKCFVLSPYMFWVEPPPFFPRVHRHAKAFQPSEALGVPRLLHRWHQQWPQKVHWLTPQAAEDCSAARMRVDIKKKHERSAMTPQKARPKPRIPHVLCATFLYSRALQRVRIEY